MAVNSKRFPVAAALRGVCATVVLCVLSANVFAQATPSGQGSTSAASPATLEPACRVQGPIADWDAAAQLIAGASSAAYSEAFTDEQKAAWTDYSKTAAADWRRLKFRYVDRIAAWRARNLPKDAPPDKFNQNQFNQNQFNQNQPNKTIDAVFYPFSGPDATNPMAFFPDAREYTLVGLEPVGCIPSNAADFAPEYWPELWKGWQSAVAMGFFKTQDMEHDLAEGSAGGVLPVLLFLIARAGNTIVDISPIGIASSGALVTPSDSVKTETRGIAIQFRGAPLSVNGKSAPAPGPANSQVRTLRYFALNLNNTRLRKKPGTMKYLEGLPATATLVKSASYLMHKRYFSDIRGLILAKSSVVVEDDSGIPFHYFDPALWDVRLFGTYDKPIELFKSGIQDDLKAAYEDRQNVQPLDFGISYKFRQGESNLLLAVRKGK